MVEEGTPREQWRLARVTDIINGDKTHPRRVLLKDAAGSKFDRHITGIVPIELEAE